MAKEIERKFLVISDSFMSIADNKEYIAQGYISTYPMTTVRVRLKGEHAYLTIKGSNKGVIRDEWEYEIPVEDAREIIDKCTGGKKIVKTRYYSGRWEIDVFHENLEGLIIAEIELSSPDELFEKPLFIGAEVTGNPIYYNSSLMEISSYEEILHLSQCID